MRLVTCKRRTPCHPFGRLATRVADTRGRATTYRGSGSAKRLNGEWAAPADRGPAHQPRWG